jgi:hypothetical protein
LRQRGATTIGLETGDTNVPDIRMTASRLALAGLLTALPVGLTTVGAGVAHAVPVAAATVHPVQVGVADAHSARHDRGDDGDRDRHGDRRDDCGRHGGVLGLVVRVLFGFDGRC